ncbi:hypothetical protein FQN54_002851 [Arachnomyces sp. PD_36]|nr:hypothetical protein FQN54_002851 [Arachnomyces sp. PD_36]
MRCFSDGSISPLITFAFTVLTVSPLPVAADRIPQNSDGSLSGYKYGQAVPISCLNRTIDTGEHIEDQQGKLQYIPFPTCNETSNPLSLRYGISETTTCTISSLSDSLYHLLEYYVHSDVPLACRVPTYPLTQAGGEPGNVDDASLFADGGSDGPAFTPLTIALQGTLQLSHLHIWSDMNVLVHRRSLSTPGKKKAPGKVIAGTAYSIPEVEFGVAEAAEKTSSREARDPWAAGQGSKVVRGEPLTLTFRVGWIEGGDVSELALLSSKAALKKGSFFSLVLILAAAGAGAMAALWWERRYGGKRGGWKGDGLLGGHNPRRGIAGGVPGVVFGDGKTSNGYGGYGLNGNGSGYGGYSTGKVD